MCITRNQPLVRTNPGFAATVLACLVCAHLHAETITLDFDSLSADPGGLTGQPVTDYFQSYGINVSGDTLAISDVRHFVNGVVEFTAPASRPNFLSGTRSPQTNVFTFSTPLNSLSFTRNALIVTGPSGTSHPEWRAWAIDVHGNFLSTVGEDLIRTFTSLPLERYILSGPNIKYVLFHSDNHNFAGYGAVILDNFTMETAAELGLAGDYNDNGVVDTSDYLLWRKHLGKSISLPNENPGALTRGLVDQEDYEFWKSRFGLAAASATSATTHGIGVPEPTATLLFVLGAWIATGIDRRSRSFRCTDPFSDLELNPIAFVRRTIR
jgi:hypothetical protein